MVFHSYMVKVRNMPRFELKKWYFDCITKEGDVVICYAAKLKYGIINFNYGSLIIKERKKEIFQKQSFFFGELNNNTETLEWKNNSLNFCGKWFGGRKGRMVKLFNSKDGSIEWQPLRYNAEVLIKYSGKTIKGLGYAEKLYLTIPPWKLPFDQLIWGRFIGDNKKDFVVWIDWKGKLNKNWIWTNKGFSQGIIKNREVIMNNGKLILNNFNKIRCDNVLNSLLKGFSLLVKIFPKKLQRLEENKYLSRGELAIDRHKIRGFSINELVKWS